MRTGTNVAANAKPFATATRNRLQRRLLEPTNPEEGDDRNLTNH
jgi:hypothetical protein